MKRIFIALSVMLALVISDAVSGGGARAEFLGDNSHVQLRHIMASVQPKPGALIPEVRPMTPVMTVPKAADVATVCQLAPRAAEAILHYFQKNPAPLMANRHINIDAVNAKHADIAAFVNRALGKNMVSEVYLVEGGGDSMATGTSARLPFAQIQGCSRVLEEYEQRMKQLLDGEKKK
ncbi:MAG: hypothetical protein NUV50_12490 [Rhodospirillales bacterium]|nr:hypothetical protein [Rhodospirillales bacterium]